MNGRVYSEVDFILENLDEEYRNKVPKKLLEIIKSKKIKYYAPKIDINKSLLDQDVERDTLVLLTMIYYNCWCENDVEKKELLQLLIHNKQKMLGDIKINQIRKFFKIKGIMDEDMNKKILEEIFKK